MTQTRRTPSVTVRNAELTDIQGIIDLSMRVYKNHTPYTQGMIQGQITKYPNGQFVVERDGEIVGYSASFRISERSAKGRHTWDSITGGGYAARHNPRGKWLYGMEVFVDPNQRRLRIGERLYDARKRLCESEELEGIIFYGRMPGWNRRKKTYPDPLDYIEAVKEKKVVDPTLNFQMRQGFECDGMLEGYDPEDKVSGGFAARMVWRNPYADDAREQKKPRHFQNESVRVATVQFQMRGVESFEEFMSNVEYFVDICSNYRCDFTVFPELFTLQLLSFGEKKQTAHAAIESLTSFTPRFVDAMRQLAISYNINIIGGSHPTITEDGDIQNVGYVFLRDGSVHTQEKIHPTPDERSWWGIVGGDDIQTILTDCGPIGVLICYDSEFPELARKLADEGAKILFVPFCTDSRQGYMRVRYCSQARAIENQCYVVMSGNVGNLPNVENLDMQYAQSAILTPCDLPFARDGIAAEASDNVETVTMCDLDLTDLAWARSEGAVQNLRDRRFDLYKTLWKGK